MWGICFMFSRSMINTGSLDSDFLNKLESKKIRIQTLQGNIEILSQLSGLDTTPDNIGRLARHVFCSFEVLDTGGVDWQHLAVLPLGSKFIVSGSLDLWRDAIINWCSPVGDDNELGEYFYYEFQKLGVRFLWSGYKQSKTRGQFYLSDK